MIKMTITTTSQSSGGTKQSTEAGTVELTAQDSSESRSGVGYYMNRKVRWCCKMPQSLFRRLVKSAASLDLTKIRMGYGHALLTKDIRALEYGQGDYAAISKTLLFKEIFKSKEVRNACVSVLSLKKFKEAYCNVKKIHLTQEYSYSYGRFVRKFNRLEHDVKTIISLDFFYSELCRRRQLEDAAEQESATLTKAGKLHMEESEVDYDINSAEKQQWIYGKLQNRATKFILLKDLKDLFLKNMPNELREEFDHEGYLELFLSNINNQENFTRLTDRICFDILKEEGGHAADTYIRNRDQFWDYCQKFRGYQVVDEFQRQGCSTLVT